MRQRFLPMVGKHHIHTPTVSIPGKLHSGRDGGLAAELVIETCVICNSSQTTQAALTSRSVPRRPYSSSSLVASMSSGTLLRHSANTHDLLRILAR
ncbi:hypothetical protein E2C01_014257 [Portunus trituberculatus]|uniref:Uncharacterized protein n=1 Tax=Portunus trituberculatus TaxID=210409 RepID=A0A5B7DJF2_PORTR|nr:hypothetical protein [Portunus trituberculatus]